MTFDMGSTAAVPATSSNLVAPPAEVLASEEEASTAIAIPDAAKSKALTMANGFVGQLLDLEPKSPDFTRKLEDLSSLGQSEVVKASSTSNSILDRRPTMRKAQDGVNANLTDLRNLIVELDPNRTDFDGVKRILKFVPGSKYISRYFAQYETAQSKLNDIVNAIKAGQDDLRKDNAAIEIERRNLWALMGDLRGYIEL
ncbi:MAG: toxic anion resistance protein, partial [Dermatophilaceae bacterium]